MTDIFSELRKAEENQFYHNLAEKYGISYGPSENSPFSYYTGHFHFDPKEKHRISVEFTPPHTLGPVKKYNLPLFLVAHFKNCAPEKAIEISSEIIKARDFLIERGYAMELSSEDATFCTYRDADLKIETVEQLEKVLGDISELDDFLRGRK